MSDAMGTPELFPMRRTERGSEHRKRYVRPYGWARCPRCSEVNQPERGIAVLVDGEHLVWKEHSYPTWAGTRMICQGSHQRVCDLPAAPNGTTQLRCTCSP